VVGILLFVGSADLRADIWPWVLTPLTAKAVGTWLIGIGVIAGYIALFDDRADVPGNSVAYLVLSRGEISSVLNALDPDVLWVEPDVEGWPRRGGHYGLAAVAREVFGAIPDHFETFALELSPRNADPPDDTGASRGRGYAPSSANRRHSPGTPRRA
jgi:hypothetical protein